MPRTLDPILQDGLENNKGSAIIRVHLARSDAATFTSNEVLYYKLSNFELEVKLAPFEFDIAPDTTYIQVERGLLINGAEYTVSSSWYIVRTIEINYYKITLKAHLFSLNNILTLEDVAVNTALAAFIAQTDIPHHTNTISYLTNAEWWKTIQFLPTGTTLTLPNPNIIFDMLINKYLVVLFDIGENKILPIGASMLTEFPATVPDHELDYTKCLRFSYTSPKPIALYFLWKDEFLSSHYQGIYTNTHHDLGFIESSVTPILSGLSNQSFFALLSPPRLDICNGDYVKLSVPFYAITEMQSRVFIDEIFDPHSKTTWFMKLQAVDWLHNVSQTSLDTAVLSPIFIREWKVRTTPSNDWVDIAWSPELNLFAAVATDGVGNRVMTSPNGITWTSRSSASDEHWYAIAWSPELGLFAAVGITGANNRVMTSPDGITWTSRTTPADQHWFGIAWSPELGLFAAVSDDGAYGRVMTSPDGITWTLRKTPVNNLWCDLTWSPELSIFVAVAYGGTGHRVMTSPDGINWTIRDTPANNDWYGVAWSPQLHLFAAVAHTGASNRVMTSPNGINWTLRETPNDIACTDIAWSPEFRLFAVTSTSGTGSRIMTSPDGINWTRRETPLNYNYYGIAWSPELLIFAAVANQEYNDRVLTSL